MKAQISIAFSPKQLEWIRAEAERRDMTISELMRELIELAMKEREKSFWREMSGREAKGVSA